MEDHPDSDKLAGRSERFKALAREYSYKLNLFLRLGLFQSRIRSWEGPVLRMEAR